MVDDGNDEQSEAQSTRPNQHGVHEDTIGRRTVKKP